jgi:hypothetical protein
VKKYLYFRKKSTFIRTRYRQNQHLWCQNGDKMSLENQGVFQLMKKETQPAIAREDWNIPCPVRGPVRSGLLVELVPDFGSRQLGTI